MIVEMRKVYSGPLEEKLKITLEMGEEPLFISDGKNLTVYAVKRLPTPEEEEIIRNALLGGMKPAETKEIKLQIKGD